MRNLQFNLDIPNDIVLPSNSDPKSDKNLKRISGIPELELDIILYHEIRYANKTGKIEA